MQLAQASTVGEAAQVLAVDVFDLGLKPLRLEKLRRLW